MHEWLQLGAKERARKTPYLARGSGDDEQRYSMAPALLDSVVSCLETWQTLQELGGIVTPSSAASREWSMVATCSRPAVAYEINAESESTCSRGVIG